jgi:flagellar biosynthesis protein FliQ
LVAIYVAPHKDAESRNKEIGVNIFENATSIVLAIAAHALAVGLVVAL